MFWHNYMSSPFTPQLEPKGKATLVSPTLYVLYCIELPLSEERWLPISEYAMCTVVRTVGYGLERVGWAASQTSFL